MFFKLVIFLGVVAIAGLGLAVTEGVRLIFLLFLVIVVTSAVVRVMQS